MQILVFTILIITTLGTQLFPKDQSKATSSSEAKPQPIPEKSSSNGGPSKGISKPQLRITFSVENKDHSISGIRGSIYGKTTISNEGSLSIALDNDEIPGNKLKIVFVDKYYIPYKKNSIENIRVFNTEKSPGNYRCYTLTKATNKWTWKLSSLEGPKFVIPEDALIVHIAPKYILRLKESYDSHFDNIIDLPEVIIDGSDYKTLMQDIDHTLIGSAMKGLSFFEIQKSHAKTIQRKKDSRPVGRVNL